MMLSKDGNVQHSVPKNVHEMDTSAHMAKASKMDMETVEKTNVTSEEELFVMDSSEREQAGDRRLMGTTGVTVTAICTSVNL